MTLELVGGRATVERTRPRHWKPSVLSLRSWSPTLYFVEQGGLTMHMPANTDTLGHGFRRPMEDARAQPGSRQPLECLNASLQPKRVSLVLGSPMQHWSDQATCEPGSGRTAGSMGAAHGVLGVKPRPSTALKLRCTCYSRAARLVSSSPPTRTTIKACAADLTEACGLVRPPQVLMLWKWRNPTATKDASNLHPHVFWKHAWNKTVLTLCIKGCVVFDFLQ